MELNEPGRFQGIGKVEFLAVSEVGKAIFLPTPDLIQGNFDTSWFSVTETF